MIRTIPNEMEWISQCVEEDDRHMHVSEYLLSGHRDEYVLIETGSSFEREQTIREITEGIGTGRLTAVLLTHSTLPHTENLGLINDMGDDIDIISATPNPTVTGLRNYTTNVQPKIMNQAREFAGLTFSFIDPLLTDIVASTWIYNHEYGILFTAEGLGHYHLPDHCALRSDEMNGGIGYNEIHSFHLDKLPYLELIDPEKLRKGFTVLFENFDIEYIAPIHGNIVVRGDIDEYLDRTMESATAMAQAWAGPNLFND